MRIESRTGEQTSIAALEAVLKSRFGWADSIVSPFALAARGKKDDVLRWPQGKRTTTYRRQRRPLATRARGSALRGF